MTLLRRISLLLAVLLAGACARERVPMDQGLELAISVRIPELGETKAAEGDVSGESWAETSIKNLKIWVFLADAIPGHPAGECLGYLQPAQDKYPQTGVENRYFITLDPDVATADPLPRVDVYVLANAYSIGQGGLNKNTTRAQLEALTLSGTQFGIQDNAPVQTSVSANNGLPFSAVGKNLSMRGKYPVFYVETVSLRRAVSKFRFVFSQLRDAAGTVTDFQVTSLQLDGGLIASQEYLFNDSANPYKIMTSDATYVAEPMLFTPPAVSEVAASYLPEQFVYDRSAMGAQEYQDLIHAGIAEGELTSWGLCYLRETDKKLQGTIEYVISGIPGSATFTMLDEGDFARNRYWIVYIYFLSDEIKFSVAWTPWEEGLDFHLTE